MDSEREDSEREDTTEVVKENTKRQLEEIQEEIDQLFIKKRKLLKKV